MPCGISYTVFDPIQTNERARFNPSKTDWYSIYLPRKDSRLSWHWWLVI